MLERKFFRVNQGGLSLIHVVLGERVAPRGDNDTSAKYHIPSTIPDSEIYAIERMNHGRICIFKIQGQRSAF